MNRLLHFKLAIDVLALAGAALLARCALAQDPFPSGMPASGNPYNPLAYGAGTRAPAQPISSSRPASWPGSAPAPGPSTSAQETGAPPTAAPSTPVGAIPPDRQFDNAEIIARIGLTEVIQAGEILPMVNERINRALAANANVPQEEIDKARVTLMKQMLKQLIETKLLLAEAKRKVPAENLTKMEGKVNEQFNKEQLPKMMDQMKAGSRAELEAKLRAAGTSIESQRRTYFERVMAYQWLRQQMKEDEEITHADMLAYYRDHASEFENTPRARWEHLMARFDKFDSKGEAYRILAGWGNQVLGGAPLAEVAKAHSHDASSYDGGVHDWTTKGSLVSEVLDEAVFGLPLNRLSQILEDDRGFHIIRVIEREDLHRKPFTDAQVEIKKKIKDERVLAQQQSYLDKLRERTSVWTIFDEVKPVN